MKRGVISSSLNSEANWVPFSAQNSPYVELLPRSQMRTGRESVRDLS